MKIKISWSEEFDLRPAQIRLLKLLANEGPMYLFRRTQDLADKTPGIYDSGECKYALSQRGWRILFALGYIKRS